jgi:hypothetical protein
MSLSLATRRARLVSVRDSILANDGGALWFLDGPMAPSPTSAPSGAPLAIVALGVDSLVLHETEAALLVTAVGYAAASGQPTWARFVDGDGLGVLDRTVGPPGSGAQMIITDGQVPPTASVWTGGELTVNHVLLEP